MENGTWGAEFDVDYEGRLTRMRWPGYPEVQIVYDGIGRQMKEILIDVQTGQVIRERRFVHDGDRIVQERDENNQKVEEYMWDGGRLLRWKNGAVTRWTHSQISGTPVRQGNETGEITGGVIYSREGEKAHSEGEDSLPIGWGGMRKTGEIEWLFGGYLAGLHRGIPGSIASLPDFLPEIPFTTGSYQGTFSIIETPYLADTIWETISEINQASKPAGQGSVEGKPNSTLCCVHEGTQRIFRQLGSIACPRGYRPVGLVIATDRAHSNEIPCAKYDESTNTWKVIAKGKDLAHCCNLPCCEIVIQCCRNGEKPPCFCRVQGNICIGDRRIQWNIPRMVRTRGRGRRRRSIISCPSPCRSAHPCCNFLSNYVDPETGIVIPIVSCENFCFCLAGPMNYDCSMDCEKACEGTQGALEALTAGLIAYSRCMARQVGERVTCGAICSPLMGNPPAYERCMEICGQQLGQQI